MKFKKLTQPLIVLFKKRKCLSINLSMYESCQYLRNVPDGPIDTFVLLNNNTGPLRQSLPTIGYLYLSSYF